MNKLKLPDADARCKIISDLNTTFLVEAGAGSGKTKSLVDRMLALLAAGECRIHNIAAVTFTRKAAAELRGRFQTELEKTVIGMEKSEIRERLAQALHFLEQSFIGTIHSFCAKILRERPIEIALDPDFEEMEEIENSVFREKCWHDFLDKEKAEGSFLEKELEDVGLFPQDLKDCFNTLSEYPEVEFKPGSEKQPDYKCIRKELELFLKQAQDIVPKYPPEKGYDGLQSLMHRCFLRQKNLGFNDYRIIMETYELLDKNPGLTQNRWPTAEQGKDFKDMFESFRESTVREAVRDWREYRHIKVFLFLKPALEFFEEKRLTHAKLNFQDQLLFTSRLLRDNPEVREYFRRKFTHILVDEFQDTDPIQAEMLLYLTGKDIKERDWRKLLPRPGSLFLVGDPKQSIFRFRRADIDTYNMVKKQIIKSGGEVLFLNTNFRSLHSLRDWVNPVMRSVFPENSNDFQAAFAPLETLREGDGTFKGVYKITIPKQKGNLEKTIVKIDSERIAEFISWACKGNIKLDRTREEKEEGLDAKAQPSDFFILLRYRKKMDIYARALEKKDIPFEITGGDAFSESEDIREIVNLVKALHAPDNEIYTVAVLRGLFFGVSDDELFKFKQSGGRFNFLGKKEDHGKESERAAKAFFTLHKWWSWMRKYPVSVALEKIFEDSGMKKQSR
jgi:ATP-dependent helicase/nuclease subunit A